MSRDQRKYKEQDKQKRAGKKAAKKIKEIEDMTLEELMAAAMKGGAVMVQLPADSPLLDQIKGDETPPNR